MAPATSPAETELSAREAAGFLLRLATIIRPHWRDFARLAMLSAVSGVLGFLSPLFARAFFDRALPTHDVTLTRWLVVATLVMAVCLSMTSLARGYQSQLLTARLQATLALWYYRHVQLQPLSVLETRAVGEINSRAADLRTAVSALSRLCDTGLATLFTFALVPPLMFLVDWRLAVAALAGVPISSGLSIVGARALRRRWRLVREETAELQAQQTDALFHIKTIRLAVAEREILGRVTAAASATVRQQMHAVAGASAFSLASAAAKACVAAIYTWLAWHLLLSRELSTGDYIALAAYVGFLTGPTLQVTGVSTELQMAGIALKRVFAYLDGATEDGASSLLASAGSADGDAPRPQGDVTFTGVTFSYGELRPALREVSFRAHRGQVTAIVGASGAGKSTIGRLLFRLDTPRAGRIAIGGVTAQSCALKPWRCAIGIVPQDATLVRGTLRDNLQLGVASASERDLAEALECCELRELVAALPFGLDTPLGGGSIVSGGQRQRIALARVLLQRPSVVLLDEATSQLDAPTEGRVLDAMLRRLRDCVVIIVSHRPGVAARCDHVIMLQQGVVVEAGSPTELSTRSASYRALQVLPEAPHATVA